jgi:L-asparagine oxygenase
MANYTLNFSDNITLKLLTEQIDKMPYEDSELFIEQATKLSNELPHNIKNLLSIFLEKGSKTGFLLLKNIIIDEDIPDTPQDNTFFVGEKTKLSKLIAILNQYLGDMISYEGECYGRLFQDMVPKKTLSDTQTSLGSKVELEIHTEQAFSKLRPDILTLGCLKGDKNAITYVLPVNIIIEQLDDYKKNLLRQPLWKIGVDLSFKINCKEFIEGNIRGPMPIIYGPKEDPFLVFDQDLMIGINEEAETLKNEIIEIYYKYRYEHILNSGEIIFIDNRRAVHGRSSFKPNFNKYDRFIIRSFVTLDLNSSIYARNINKRMIEAKYS